MLFSRPFTAGQMSPDAVQYLLAKYVLAASKGCLSLRSKRISPHVLRHSAAMELLDAGVDSTVISLWLGHESTRSTQPYLHAHLAIKEVALAKIETVRPTEAFRCLGVAELRTAGHIPG
jgi:site-specific recombinase XerD